MITDILFVHTKTKLHALKPCFYDTSTIDLCLVWGFRQKLDTVSTYRHRVIFWTIYREVFEAILFTIVVVVVVG